MPGGRALVVASLLSLCAAVGCARYRSAEAAPASPEPATAARVVQVLYRPAPGVPSQPDEVALTHLADRAVERLTDQLFALDGWRALCGETPLVYTTPTQGRLARAVGRRLSLLRGVEVEIVESDQPPPARACLWVVAPRWVGERVLPASFSCERLSSAGGPATLIDLLAPEVDERSWEAAEIIGASDPRAAALVAHRILSGRARGGLGDLGEQAAQCGIDRRSLQWTAEAMDE